MISLTLRMGRSHMTMCRRMQCFHKLCSSRRKGEDQQRVGKCGDYHGRLPPRSNHSIRQSKCIPNRRGSHHSPRSKFPRVSRQRHLRARQEQGQGQGQFRLDSRHHSRNRIHSPRNQDNLRFRRNMILRGLRGWLQQELGQKKRGGSMMTRCSCTWRELSMGQKRNFRKFGMNLCKKGK